jgi:3-hydroxybutyryl-CoA dehydratase
MTEEAPIAICWQDLHVGQNASFKFCVGQKEMDEFMNFSGDRSRIHRDTGFAQRNDFQSPVVYGAIIVAKISYLVGMLLPGDFGLATEWKVYFNRPLYINDLAEMRGEITHVSDATRIVKLKITVLRGSEIIATAVAGSKLLNP